MIGARDATGDAVAKRFARVQEEVWAMTTLALSPWLPWPMAGHQRPVKVLNHACGRARRFWHAQVFSWRADILRPIPH